MDGKTLFNDYYTRKLFNIKFIRRNMKEGGKKVRTVGKQTEGLHHAHIRKRIHQRHEEFPHPNKFKRFMDKAIFAIGLIGPIMTIPQLLTIWLTHSASGISLVTWCAYCFTAFFWLMYGILHKEKPIIITYSAFLIVDLLVVLGTAIYG